MNRICESQVRSGHCHQVPLMWSVILIHLAVLVELSTSCLPTQTVVTTTTTVAPYPCSVCPMIYGSGCLGGATDVCATIAEVGLTYTLGVITGYNFGDSNTCSTIFSCPLGTTSQVKLPITGSVVPGPSLVIAWCQETGTNAGTWYYGIPPLTTPVEIVATQCQGIVSG